MNENLESSNETNPTTVDFEVIIEDCLFETKCTEFVGSCILANYSQLSADIFTTMNITSSYSDSSVPNMTSSYLDSSVALQNEVNKSAFEDSIMVEDILEDILISDSKCSLLNALTCLTDFLGAEEMKTKFGLCVNWTDGSADEDECAKELQGFVPPNPSAAKANEKVSNS